MMTGHDNYLDSMANTRSRYDGDEDDTYSEDEGVGSDAEETPAESGDEGDEDD